MQFILENLQDYPKVVEYVGFYREPIRNLKEGDPLPGGGEVTKEKKSLIESLENIDSKETHKRVHEILQDEDTKLECIKAKATLRKNAECLMSSGAATDFMADEDTFFVHPEDMDDVGSKCEPLLFIAGFSAIRRTLELTFANPEDLENHEQEEEMQNILDFMTCNLENDEEATEKCEEELDRITETIGEEFDIAVDLTEEEEKELEKFFEELEEEHGDKLKELEYEFEAIEKELEDEYEKEKEGTHYEGDHPEGGTHYEGDHPEGGTHYEGDHPEGGTHYEGDHPEGETHYEDDHPEGPHTEDDHPDGGTHYEDDHPEGPHTEDDHPDGGTHYEDDHPEGPHTEDDEEYAYEGTATFPFGPNHEPPERKGGERRLASDNKKTIKYKSSTKGYKTEGKDLSGVEYKKFDDYVKTRSAFLISWGVVLSLFAVTW